MDKTRENLLKKAQEGKLGHFFIVNPPGRAKNPKNSLMSWCDGLIKAYFKSYSRPSEDIKNLEDVLVIDEEIVSKKFYDKVFTQTISQFLSHKAVVGDRKFIVIEDLDRMSQIHANKLLKIFEEPPVNATIFLLNPSGAKPLPTISSRAVALRAEVPVENGLLNLEKWNKKLSDKNLHQFCDFFKARPDEEKDFARALSDQMGPKTNKELLAKTDKFLRTQIEDSLFNHNSYSRLTLLREIYLEVQKSIET